VPHWLAHQAALLPLISSYASAVDQVAIPYPISSGESSYGLWTPRTITSLCAGQLRQNACWLGCNKPGSALMYNLGTSLRESHAP
jgi:hypothetical protein